ncbi:hypothetical protein ZOSMA_278G00160 [Zostera marina]|uniref:Uncharacterized protein n=1 Tax=Zostera marina TaxID=29655 RepID=A0A0K9PG05_ZOSMR|nr:hypothetical protein ZOSMA_278G00160 [Zostera marina]
MMILRRSQTLIQIFMFLLPQRRDPD